MSRGFFVAKKAAALKMLPRGNNKITATAAVEENSFRTPHTSEYALRLRSDKQKGKNTAVKLWFQFGVPEAANSNIGLF